MEPQLPHLHYYRPTPAASDPQTHVSEVCIYGGTSAGIVAAVAAHRLGESVELAVFDIHLGGLTTGGLGATDIGNKDAIGGISREFYQRLGQYYQTDNGESWTFEPSAASKVYRDMLDEADITPRFHQQLHRVHKNGTAIEALEMADGTVYRAKVFIDATYEGDLLAMAGVSFHVGRESNRTYHETLNGIHFGHPNHNFKAWGDPYRTPGDPSSGLIPLVQDVEPGVPGMGDDCVQAYNFRMCLTDVEANRLPFPKPLDYDADRYEIFRRYLKLGFWDVMRLSLRMPNGKTDTNNFGPLATDHIGANYGWPNGSYAQREAIFQDHVSYTAGMFYFLQHDAGVPTQVRDQMQRWGLCRDEFVETGGFPPQLYIREARRMVSDYVMTEHDCRYLRTAERSVGLAAYAMDSHNCRRLVIDGRVTNEGNVETHPDKPYPIAFESIVPRCEECSNLVVPVCLSSSHIAFGSIRMEPVFMVLAQSAACVAHLAIQHENEVSRVPYDELRVILLKSDQVLTWPPEVLTKHNDAWDFDVADLS